MSDPMEPLNKISKRLAEEAEALGLHLEQVAVFPNMSGDPDAPLMMQGVFTIRPEAVEEAEPEKTEDQLQVDAMFEDIVRGSQKDEEKEKQVGMVDEIKSWLEET